MKKKIVVFCDKYLGFTLLSSGGVLEDLIAAYDVTIITTSSAVESIRNVTHGQCDIVAYDVNGKLKKNYLSTTLSDIFSMTYAIGADGRINLTGRLHRKAHLKLARKKGLKSKAQKLLVVILSILASKYKPLRDEFQTLFFRVAPKDSVKAVLQDIRPALAIATTAGLSHDGIFFAAAHSLNIPCLAMIQSWDRTASKGYPTVHPDHCIVWNEAMMYEAHNFLDIPNDRIYVAGAPPWDKYLSNPAVLTAAEKSAFFKRWNLDEGKKLVFVALNGPATHAENLKMIRDICSASANGMIDGVQIMFRSHPAYLIDPVGTKSISDAFEEFKLSDMHLMHPIVIDSSVRHHIVAEEDRRFMHDMFRACDLTVSIMSTWMIESSVFDKPNICIEYGRYVTNLFDFDLSEYQAEHIVRIFSYGAVYRVHSTPEMISTLMSVLAHPAERTQARRRLADMEAGPNKGSARRAVREKIAELIEKTAL